MRCPSHGHRGTLRAICLSVAAWAAGPAVSQGLELRAETQLQLSPAARASLQSALERVGVGCGETQARQSVGLTLLDAVEHVLCRSPQLAQSVFLVDEQQAVVEAAQAQWRPRASASVEYAANRIPASNSAAGSLSASVTGSLGLSWVAYDGGIRAAGLEQARQQLGSAQASQRSTVLTALNEVMRLYVEAATAWARLDALRDAEATARRSLDAAIAKHDAKVASLAERLQAETALAQAVLERIRAEGTWATASGLLAVAMGLDPEARLALAPVESAFPGAAARASGRAWMIQARERHPRLQAARADVQAQRARLDAVRAERNMNVQLGVGANTTRDLASGGGGFVHALAGSAVASVPLYTPDQTAREAQVVAQIGAREAALVQVERDVDSELWRAARTLDTEAENLRGANELLAAAARSYDITEGRYRAGVGSILELLTAQTALAGARSQVAQSQLAHAQALLRIEVLAGTVRLQRQ